MQKVMAFIKDVIWGQKGASCPHFWMNVLRVNYIIKANMAASWINLLKIKFLISKNKENYLFKDANNIFILLMGTWFH